MVSTQQNGGANATPQREEKQTETKDKKNGRSGDDGMDASIMTLQLLNGRRHNHKYVSIPMGVLSYSIHIHLFSQNQSLLLLI